MYRVFILLCGLFFFNCADAQLSKYGKPAGFEDVQTVYIYQKSNWDGTHASKIYLYLEDSNHLQSFKWFEGENEATLVTADFDWVTYSVKKFSNYHLEKEMEPQLKASLIFDGSKKINIEVGSMHDSMTLIGLPWQSYDFDFAGLGLSWRALKNKKKDFYFHIADVAREPNGMRFANKGRVDVVYKKEVALNGKNCLLYDINGSGLENKGGQIWINANNFMIEQYKIEIPDEPGYDNGMLQLVETKKMSKAEWEQFKNTAVGNPVPHE